MSPLTMRWASPSTMAVLPTPGSPISTGLFLVRRDRTWITRRTSSSRPITGSSLPCRATSVRLRAYFSRAWYFSSGYGHRYPSLHPLAAAVRNDFSRRRGQRHLAETSTADLGQLLEQFFGFICPKLRRVVRGEIKFAPPSCQARGLGAEPPIVFVHIFLDLYTTLWYFVVSIDSHMIENLQQIARQAWSNQWTASNS
jgi:hypothetical protein